MSCDFGKNIMESKREGERIAKVIARAGICSRRAAEVLIAEGKVMVDDKVIDSPAVKVTDANKIMVHNKLLPTKEAAKLWIFHKPRGCLTTNYDPEGRQTIFDILPKTLPRVITIGRLDYNSEGLLLLTNDGGLARHMELPASGWVRRYRARAYGSVNIRVVDEIKNGVTIEGIKYEPAEITIERATGDNFWLEVAVKEGKNREVRKLLDYAGLKVSRLIRTEYGSFKLGSLARGSVVPVAAGEVEQVARPNQ
jgi:23S rRNA pseudouridine2605 synthase